jgi:membrane associated rhomboid family serine protease
MGLAERDYRRREPQPSGFAAVRTWSATAWLIATFVTIFVIDAMLTPPWPMSMASLGSEANLSMASILMTSFGPGVRWTHFSLTTAIEQQQVWRIVTFSIAHTGIWSLAINVACLWFFARELERDIGATRLLVLFALSSLAAPAMYAALHYGNLGIAEPWFVLAGATAGVLGVAVAAACAGPDDDVFFWNSGAFLPRRTIAWIAVVVVVLVAIKQDPSGASTAHVGGGAMGLILARPLVPRGIRLARD